MYHIFSILSERSERAVVAIQDLQASGAIFWYIALPVAKVLCGLLKSYGRLLGPVAKVLCKVLCMSPPSVLWHRGR